MIGSLWTAGFIIPHQMVRIPDSVIYHAPMVADVDLHSPLVTGIIFYVTGYAALSVWEEFVVPQLKLRSILPDVPLVDGQLTEKERTEPWITPLTADQTLPLPTLEMLRTKDHHRIGRREGVTQYITTDEKLTRIRGVQEEVEAWNDFYGVPITVYKEHKW